MVWRAYEREATKEEEEEWAKELAVNHPAPIARHGVASAKHAREQARAYVQEKKALLRVYAKGDWVLRVRQRQHKGEPYYDGPYSVVGTHAGNVYSIATPGGIRLVNRYNGTNLFPAYTRDGEPVRSL